MKRRFDSRHITKCVVIIVLCFCFIFHANALTLFSSNYDKDIWTENQLVYETPESVPSTWHPLKAASEHLPITVLWDDAERDVVVFSHLMYQKYPMRAERRYSADKTYDDLKIVNGVTYCSPRFLVRLLCGHGFIHKDEVFFFAGESVNSRLISEGDSKVFAGNVITAMYELRLKMPDEYDFARKYLPGGIKYIPKDKVDEDARDAVAYMIFGERRNKCYIVGDGHEGCDLASYIAHEAYHVWQYKNWGIDGATEEGAEEYESYIYKYLLCD